MICPTCKMSWNIGGCKLCGECPACVTIIDQYINGLSQNLKALNLNVIEGDRETSHSCYYEPMILTEQEVIIKGAEGICRTQKGN